MSILDRYGITVEGIQPQFSNLVVLFSSEKMMAGMPPMQRQGHRLLHRIHRIMKLVENNSPLLVRLSVGRTVISFFFRLRSDHIFYFIAETLDYILCKYDNLSANMRV